MNSSPQRIVCLSAEAADWLCRIGAWDRVIGVTSFFVAPPDAPPKPRISGFSSGCLNEILQLKPDLAITFSDVQATMASELIRNGIPVLATNQRTLAETEATLLLLSRVVNQESQAEPWLEKFRRCLVPEPALGERPHVYFEEWPNPIISGIAWISELIERAGGHDVFCHLQDQRAARNRMLALETVCQANPEVIFASWCGRPFQPSVLESREGWEQIEAVRHRNIFEIPPEDILQPGFRLVFGYERIKQHLKAFGNQYKPATIQRTFP